MMGRGSTLSENQRRLVRIARRGGRWAVVGAALAVVVACAPLSPTPPFHLAETARVLPKGGMSANGALGAGKFEDIGSAIGMGGRVRLGVGANQEVGAEATVLGRIINDEQPTPERPWQGKTSVFAGKLAWKLGIASWFAALAGAGGSHSATGNALGADLAVLASTPQLLIDRFRPYLGVRGGIARPVGRDVNEAGGITKGLTIAGGSSWELTGRVQVFLEGGYLHEWNTGYFATAADPNRTIQSQNHPGGYFAFGATYLFGATSP
jgi:hypothetical protein